MAHPLDTCMRTLSALITADIPSGEASADASIVAYLATFPGPQKQIAALSMLDHAIDQRLSPSPFLPILKGIVAGHYEKLGTTRS
ncbi:hypothetical protein G3T14_09860 [Methylobacterium sp. BTF04]|uniref:hypothetical protein n=1 Tax=Methylobacterium sp. BTF04 TaxID=2708300 RepID=UPI0013D6F8EC|nr:hypothetical protein [Methylobacterium sp. BTF04]NEU12439.1 hypothetical protein [Methylobacterium sp. BTF04]